METTESSEILVVVKNSSKTLRKKHLVYETYEVKSTDPVIRSCVKDTLAEFGDDEGDQPDSIKVQVTLTI